MTQLCLLGLSDSPRHDSNSAAVLRGLQDALAPKAALDLFSLHYNEDDDGVIMAWPEHNHGMSGVLKNGLDWASRPYGRAVLRGKPVLPMTGSPAITGGVRAQQQMNETLASVSARPVLRPQIVIGGVHEKGARPALRRRSHAALLRWRRR